MDEDADAHGQAARHVHLLHTRQRDVRPSHVARGQSGELGVEVLRGGEERARDVVRLQIIGVDEGGEQFVGGFENGVFGVRLYRRCTADPA